MLKYLSHLKILLLTIITLVGFQVHAQSLKDIKISIDTTSSSCSSLTLKFTAVNIPSEKIKFTWVIDTITKKVITYNIGNASSVTAIEHTFNKHDLYKVHLLAENVLNEGDPYYIDTTVVFEPHAFFTWAISKEENGNFEVDFTGYANKGAGTVYNWSYGSSSIGTTNKISHTFKEGFHKVKYQVTQGGCTVSDSSIIRAIPAELPDSIKTSSGLKGIYPNVFTPNGDKLNDVLYIPSNGKDSYKFEVYDLGGMLIYKRESPVIEWDGRTISGQEAKAGQYIYIIKLGSKVLHKQFFALFR
jgi:gliding motility-associated-like protein